MSPAVSNPNYPSALADRLYASLDSETRKAVMLPHVGLDLGANPTEQEIIELIDEAYATSDSKTRQAFVQPYLDLEMPPSVVKAATKPFPRDFDADASFTLDEFLARVTSEDQSDTTR